MTLPITTASNERFFSSLKLVKTHLRLTMRNERLSDLLVIAVESDVSGKINLDDAVDIFSKNEKKNISFNKLIVFFLINKNCYT